LFSLELRVLEAASLLVDGHRSSAFFDRSADRSSTCVVNVELVE
jgi:hypothetical protein